MGYIFRLLDCSIRSPPKKAAFELAGEMSFVSHAQNFEDVMLWRALKSVEGGFYIDVGACWPDQHSVTHAFYERGWHGINIEPNPDFFSQLRKERPRDINLDVAVGDERGTAEMHFVADTGLSTLNPEFAVQHEKGGFLTDTRKVEITTLSDIWQHNISENQEVHFLKIDVEGHEKAVLQGNDWTTGRPWIVVVEATLPLSQEECHQDWEPILLKAGYLFTYADGLNRFYVAGEQKNLLNAFKYPPNVFDDYTTYSHLQAITRANEAEASLATLKSEYEKSRTSRMRTTLRQIRRLFRLQIAIGIFGTSIEAVDTAMTFAFQL